MILYHCSIALLHLIIDNKNTNEKIENLQKPRQEVHGNQLKGQKCSSGHYDEPEVKK